MRKSFEYKPLQRINPDVLEYKLRDNPDRDTVNFVVDGFRNGFKVGMTRRPKPREPGKNLREVERNPEVTQRIIDEEVRKGHILGPFKEPTISKYGVFTT